MEDSKSKPELQRCKAENAELDGENGFTGLSSSSLIPFVRQGPDIVQRAPANKIYYKMVHDSEIVVML